MDQAALEAWKQEENVAGTGFTDVNKHFEDGLAALPQRSDTKKARDIFTEGAAQLGLAGEALARIRKLREAEAATPTKSLVGADDQSYAPNSNSNAPAGMPTQDKDPSTGVWYARNYMGISSDGKRGSLVIRDGHPVYALFYDGSTHADLDAVHAYQRAVKTPAQSSELTQTVNTGGNPAGVTMKYPTYEESHNFGKPDPLPPLEGKLFDLMMIYHTNNWGDVHPDVKLREALGDKFNAYVNEYGPNSGGGARYGETLAWQAAQK